MMTKDAVLKLDRTGSGAMVADIYLPEMFLKKTLHSSCCFVSKHDL